MTLSLAALENPVIGENEDGSELRLHDVDARDPRFLSWQNNHIYGGVALTPAENKQVSGVVQQATINELSRQQKQKVERDTAALVQHMVSQARAKGRTHFTPADGMVITNDAKREDLQQLFDDPRLLGVSQEAQTKINNQVRAAYQSGAQEGNESVDMKEVNRVFYSLVDGKETGIMIGPVNNRKKADGSVNTALLWVNTQDPDWAIKTENSLEQAQITNRANEEKQKLITAKLLNEKPLETALNLLDPRNPATVDAAEDAIIALNQQVDAREDIDEATKRALKKFNNDELQTAIAGNYTILYERSKEEMSEKIAEMHSGLYTRQELLMELEAKKSVMDHKDWIKLYNLANKEPDPITQAAADELKTRIDARKQELRKDRTLSPEQRTAATRGIQSMRQQYIDITRDYRDGKLTEAEYTEKVASIKPPVEVELAKGGVTTFKENQALSLLQGFDNEGDYSAPAFNNMLRVMSTRQKNGQLAKAYKNGSHILNAEAVLHLYSGSRGGNSSGYDYNKFAKLLRKNNIDPLVLLEQQTRLILNGPDLVKDEADNAALEQLRVLQGRMQQELRERGQQVSVLDPSQQRPRLVAARERTGAALSLLDSLLGVQPAAAANMELPPPQVPAQIARTTGPITHQNIRVSAGSRQQSVARAAERVGIHPAHLAAIMSFETAGTFDPASRNNLGYVGLIQFGDWEQKNYGVNRQTPFEQQAAAAAQFLIDRGVKPGDGIDRIYAAVLVGNADGRLKDGSDGMGAKDAYGTSVRNALEELSPGGAHYKKALRFLRGG